MKREGRKKEKKSVRLKKEIKKRRGRKSKRLRKEEAVYQVNT